MPLPRSVLAPIEPVDRDLRVTAGAMPAGIGGEIFISAPHATTVGPPHAFFGAGMSYRLSLAPGTHGAEPGTFAWRQAWIDSPSARLQHKRPDVFTRTMLGVQSPFGLVNAANTAPLPWGDRLFMTWDVGRPVEIDPVSLRSLGEVGRADEWQVFDLMPGPVLPMVTSTAHPVVDPERGCLWTVNTYLGQLWIVRWDGEGPVRRWPVAGAFVPQSVHTITQTREWIIVGDCAFKAEASVMFGGERTEPANPDEPIYLIRKADLDGTAPGTEVTCRTYTLAPEMNHYYACYDDSDGVVVMFEHTENADIAMAVRAGDIDAWGRPVDPALAGLYGFPMSPTRTSLHRFDPESGEQRELAVYCEPAGHWSRQLSAFDWSAEGWAAPEAVHTVHHGFRPEAVVQRMLDLYRDRVDRTLLPTEETASSIVTLAWDGLAPISDYVFPAIDDLPSSPIFVPVAPGADGRSAHGGERAGGLHGWVVVPVMSDHGFRVEIFSAADVGAGPVCTLTAPDHTVPFILHSAWAPRAVAAPAVERTRFADDLARVEELPEDLAAAARAVARELDEGVPMVSPASGS
ncbi:MAG: carotenoid oxygenase family protein [Actinomycetota bacterium]